MNTERAGPSDREVVLQALAEEFGGTLHLAPPGMPLHDLVMAHLQPVRSPVPASQAPLLVLALESVPGLAGSSFLVDLDPRMRPRCRLVAGRAGDEDIFLALINRHIDPQVQNPPLPLAAANDNAPRPDVPDMMDSPLAPEVAGGLLADVSRWILDTAIVPSPELAMVSAASLIAGVWGRKVLTPLGGGVNLYAATLLHTAGGKGHPPKAIRALADKAGLMGAVSNGDHTSYAAFERTLRKHPSTVVVMDEFGITLTDINGRHTSSPAASIRKFLLAIYDQANSKFDGRIYASEQTKANDSPIDGPALTVLGMTTPETLFAGLSEASIADGFINRFIFATAAPPEGISPPRLDRDSKPPSSLVASLQAAFAACPRGDGNLLPAKFRVPFEGGEDGDAYRLWGEIFMWQHDPVWSAMDTGINGRAAENTLRLATIRAISRNPGAPEVDVDDVRWGWGIVHSSIALVTDGARRHLASSPAEALRKSIVAALEDAPDRTLPLSKILERRGVRGADLRELDAAMGWLVSSGQVTDLTGRPRPGRGSKLRLNP